MRRTPRRLIGTIVAVAALLAVIPASAQALGLTALAAQPATNTQAGANADFHIHVGFTNASDDVHDIRISLPPGQIGNPTVTPQCTPAQFNGSGCPANTQVGSVVSNVAALGLLPLAVNGKLFNMVPGPGEPAHFGILLSPTGGLLPLGDIRLESTVELRQSDLGLDTVIPVIPNTALGIIPLDITSMDVTLFGDSPRFARNPTSCSTATTHFLAHSYVAPASDVTGSASYTPTGCENEDFSPSFSATVGGAAQGAQTTALTSIDQDANEAGLLNAHVFVPPDLAPNTLTDLLSHRCPPADFQVGNCMANAVVGNAIATSPLLSQPLTGQVILVDNGGGLLPNVGLDLRGPLHLLLQGSLNADKSVTFAGLPDIPIAHFQLAFTNPPGLLIANRNLCIGAPPVWHAEFTGYNGATTAVDSTATVDGPCGVAGGVGGKCKKSKKKHRHHRAAEAKKKHKKHSCKKKKHHKKKR
jgi:hypothetical protein